MGGFWNTITGKDKRRQKHKYNEALNQYNSYAGEAQRTIENLSKQLQQSMHGLHSLEQQQYQHHLKGSELHQHVSNYQNVLHNLESQKANVASEAEQLKQAFSSFKSKAPLLEGKISEIEKLPNIFHNLYDTISKQKESLKGLTEEEAVSQIKKHRQDVENLKKQREETENKIRNSMLEIGKEHKGLTIDKTNLESAIKSYQLQQNRLLQESSNVNNSRSNLEQIIRAYKNQQDYLTGAYSKQQNYVNSQERQLQNYGANAQNQLDALSQHLDWRAGKYKKVANLTGLAQGAGLAALTLGIGSGIGYLGGTSGIVGNIASGLKTLAPLVGIGHYMHTANSGKKIGNYQPISLGSGSYPQDLSQIAQYGLGSPKVSIPELGGLKQSLEHFNMPIIPKLKDLPPLHEALGKIVSLQDIEGLTLGLPQMTSASGKKYSHEVLYNPEFIKKLKKLSRGLGTPSLKANTSLNLKPNIGAVNIAYA